MSHERILNLCNRVRAKLGKKPVKRLKKGVMDDSACCPIARTIGGVEVGDTTIDKAWTWETIITLPKYAQDWIKAFDNKEIPELLSDPNQAVRDRPLL